MVTGNEAYAETGAETTDAVMPSIDEQIVVVVDPVTPQKTAVVDNVEVGVGVLG